jgi:Domain of unknown function (DUF309)
MIPTAPLAARNRLAELILAALSEPRARAELSELAGAATPPAWSASDDPRHAALVLERARRAAAALERRPFIDRDRSLPSALDAAADLFEAGLGFEMHEMLEPHWQAASGAEREALQGLIQIAVGYQHLANGNGIGGRSLLADGAERLRAGALEGLDTRALVGEVEAALRVPPGPGEPLPPFPRTPSGRTP